MPSLPFLQQPLGLPSGSSQSATLSTEGWPVVAVELPAGTQGAYLEILTGAAEGTPRRVYLADQSTVAPLRLKLPDTLAAEAVVMQLEPALTIGRGSLALRTLQSDGSTPQTQGAARALTLFLVRRG